MRLLLVALVALAGLLPARAATFYVTVAGLGGTPDYVQRYTAAADTLNAIFKQNAPAEDVFTLTGAAATRADLNQTLAQVAAAAHAIDDFVLILIGHGTYDGVEYKFNLVGPDITASELARLCERIRARRQLVVLTTECSGAAVSVLASPIRGVLAATKTGMEKNATVFARYFVQGLQDPTADLNKDQVISAIEAFRFAQRRVADYYKTQQRLATEHASSSADRLLTDIPLVRFGAIQRAYANPANHALLARKEELERQIDALNYRKDSLADDDYKTQMTALLLALAKIDKELRP
ncbi:MAG: hypothetical protein ACRD2D_01190 [Terriglobales bacterium]